MDRDPNKLLESLNAMPAEDRETILNAFRSLLGLVSQRVGARQNDENAFTPRALDFGDDNRPNWVFYQPPSTSDEANQLVVWNPSADNVPPNTPPPTDFSSNGANNLGSVASSTGNVPTTTIPPTPPPSDTSTRQATNPPSGRRVRFLPETYSREPNGSSPDPALTHPLLTQLLIAVQSSQHSPTSANNSTNESPNHGDWLSQLANELHDVLNMQHHPSNLRVTEPR